MRHVKHKVDYQSECIYVLSDTHIDHPNTDMKLLRKHIDNIDKHDIPWIHLGDWVDSINPLDKRYDVKSTNKETIVDSYEKAFDLFSPISDQCVAILRGNHGSKWSKIEGDFIKIFAKRWGVPYLGYCGFVTVTLKGAKHRIWLHHGAGGGRKRGAKTIRLSEWPLFVDADIYLQGHTHTYVAFHDEIVTPTRKRLRWFGNAPGYIRSYTGHDDYIEELGLQPQPPGCIRLTLDKGVKIEAVLE